jgi:hypothetical protein
LQVEQVPEPMHLEQVRRVPVGESRRIVPDITEYGVGRFLMMCPAPSHRMHFPDPRHPGQAFFSLLGIS